MDNPQESTGTLNINQAADAMSNLMEPIEAIDPNPPVDTEIDVKPPEKEEKPDEEVKEPDEEGEAVTIEVDGKTVTLTKAELADAYKNGLRQADYTKKTMEAAEQRKTAEVETAKTRQEREQYAQNLNRMATQLEVVLLQQQQTDMAALLESDPVDYLKQQHLFQQRQAQLNQINFQRQAIAEQQQAEQAQSHAQFIQQQHQELLDKLPGWKDETKAKAERVALKDFLKGKGFSEQEMNISDHKTVILAREAMLYNQMMEKANAASKKVQAAPQRVVRSGVAETGKPDGRTVAMQRLNKSGSIRDAASVFATLL